MKIIWVLLAVSLMQGSAASSAAMTSWMSVFGGPKKDSIFNLVERADGSFVGVGKVDTKGFSQPWILFVSASGVVVDSREWKEKGVFTSIVNTLDGGFLVAGHRRKDDADVWVLKFAADLKLDWEKTYGGSHDDLGMALVALKDGSFLVGADSYSAGHGHRGCAGGHRDYLITRIDAKGAVQWSKSFGGTNHEYLSQIAQTTDGNFVAYGRTESFDGDVKNFMGEYDGWAVKFSGQGDLIWETTIGGAMWDWGSNVVATADGGVMVSGYVFSWDGDGKGNKGDYDYSLVKLNAKGQREWARMFGGSVDDFAQGAVVLDDGSFLVTGGSVSSDGDVPENRGNFDLWAIRVSAKGKLLWSRTYGGSAYDIASPGGSDYYVAGPGGGLIKTMDGGVAIAAATKSTDGDVGRAGGKTDAWIVKWSPKEWSGKKLEKRGQLNPVRRTDKKVSPRNPGSAPGLAWLKRIGGRGNQSPLDSPQALIQDGSGGYTLISTSDDRAWIVNTDGEGRTRWQKKYSGPLGRSPTVGAAIAKRLDGRGYVFSATQNNDILAVGIDNRGRVQWERRLGGSAPDQATSLVASRDGGFIVGGNSYSNDGDVTDHICGYDYWVAKIDGQGELLWSRSVGGSSNDFLIQLVEAPNGDVALIGRTESIDGMAKGNHGMYDYLAARLDANGKVKWTKTYGGIDWEWGNSVVATKDGGFLLGGYSYTFDDFELGQIKCNHGEFDFWVAKTNADGDLEWQQCFGGSNYELGYGMLQLKDGNFAMVGGSPSHDGQVTGNHGGWDVWVVKFDTKGKLLWEKSVGGPEYDIGYALVEDPDGALVVLGETDSKTRQDLLLFKLK